MNSKKDSATTPRVQGPKQAPRAKDRRYQPPRILRKRSVSKATLWSGAGVGGAGSVLFGA